MNVTCCYRLLTNIIFLFVQFRILLNESQLNFKSHKKKQYNKGVEELKSAVHWSTKTLWTMKNIYIHFLTWFEKIILMNRNLNANANKETLKSSIFIHAISSAQHLKHGTQ